MVHVFSKNFKMSVGAQYHTKKTTPMSQNNAQVRQDLQVKLVQLELQLFEVEGDPVAEAAVQRKIDAYTRALAKIDAILAQPLTTAPAAVDAPAVCNNQNSICSW